MRLKRREGEEKGVRAAQENTNSRVHAQTFNTVYLCALSKHSKRKKKRIYFLEKFAFVQLYTVVCVYEKTTQENTKKKK